MEQPTHSNRRKIGVLSKPFWQRNNHARISRNRHKCFTSQAESKRVTFHTSWIVSVNSNFWDPANSMAKILDILRTQKWLFLYDQIKLCLKNQAIQIENVLSKNIYSEIRAGYETTPTAQATFEEQFPDVCLDWHDIYKFEDKCCVVTHRAADIRVAWLVYLACLSSHVLRANCNFESKQANSITLFGRRPNEKESLNTARKWERRARISEVGFLWESLGWARIKCLLSALTSVYGRFPVTKNFRKLPWKGPSSEECVPFDTSSIRLCVRHQNSRRVAQISPWISWNCRWLLVKTREWNMLFHWKFSNGKTGLPF